MAYCVSCRACQKEATTSFKLSVWHQLSRWSAQKADNGYKRLLRVGGLYICLTTTILSLLEFRETSYTLKNTSKPTQVLSDHIFRFSTSLALEWVSEQDCEPCALVLVWTKVYLSEPAILGVLVTRRDVNDPPTWCGAASTTLWGGHGDPHLLGEVP